MMRRRRRRMVMMMMMMMMMMVVMVVVVVVMVTSTKPAGETHPTFGRSNEGGEDDPGCIVPSEASLQDTGAAVDDQGRGVFIRPLHLARRHGSLLESWETQGSLLERWETQGSLLERWET